MASETLGEIHWYITYLGDDAHAIECPTVDFEGNETGIVKVFEGTLVECGEWLTSLAKMEEAIDG